MKEEKVLQLLMRFRNFWMRDKPIKIWVDECSKFYNRLMKLQWQNI